MILQFLIRVLTQSSQKLHTSNFLVNNEFNDPNDKSGCKDQPT